MINHDIMGSFPQGYEPNDSQKYILEEIGIALSQGKKYIIIQAPTATGKSMIAKTFANYSKDCSSDFAASVDNNSIFSPNYSEEYERFGTAILTCTKSLQDQYISLFPSGRCFKGRSNYPCDVNDEVSCESGMCFFDKKTKAKCIATHRCPYFNARNETIKNKCQFLNYSVFMALYPQVKNKDFIVCDEASELESLLVNEFTATINIKLLKKTLKNVPVTPTVSDSYESYYYWISSVAGLCEDIVIEMESKLGKKKKISKEDYEKYSKAKDYFRKFSMLQGSWYQTNYIISRENDLLIFKPYEVDRLAKNIFDYGDVNILMSATIVDHKNFAKTLGIDDYYYIEAPCALDAKKAPIRCVDKYKVSYNNKNSVLPILAHLSKQICEKHKGQKGLIHTHSMEILGYVKKEMGKDKRYLYREPGISNEDIYKEHKEREDDTVMVSPSMTHGIDLKDNLGEFQIILKAPYSPLGDDRIKKKFNEDKEWYQNNMLSTLIQACGRCNRIQSDYAVTYILDGVAVDAIRRNMDKLPKYFRERLI